MTTTAILQHQFTNIRLVTAINNRFTNRKNRILLLPTPHHMHGDIRRRVQSINHKTIAGVKHVFFAQIKQNQIAILLGTTMQLFDIGFSMFVIKINTLCNIRKGQNLLHIFVKPHVINQRHHQIIVGNAEITKPPQTRPRIHQKRQ